MNFSFSFRANFTDNRGSTLLKRQILLVGPGAVEQQSDFKVYHLTSKNKDFLKHLFCIKVLLNGSRFEAAVEISKSRICFPRNNPSHKIISSINSDYCFVQINYPTDILQRVFIKTLKLKIISKTIQLVALRMSRRHFQLRNQRSYWFYRRNLCVSLDSQERSSNNHLNFFLGEGG